MNMEFSPDWVVPPGKTLKIIMHRKRINKNDLVDRLGIPERDLEYFLKGKFELNYAIAKDISEVTSTDINFWLTREKEYRKNIRQHKARIQDEKDWLKAVGYSDMVRYGWLDLHRSHAKKVEACFDFFSVSAIDEWYRKYQETLYYTAFRKSISFEQNDEAVISWIRMSDFLSKSEKNILEWNKKYLAKNIPRIRELVAVRDPEVFVPKLKSLFLECGVLFCILPPPRGCRASGMVRYTETGNPMIMLSGRYKSDDQFWFTLFHEIGHLVLHDDGGIKLEGICPNDEMEDEADEFSRDVLIPSHYQGKVSALRVSDWKKIIRTSKEISVTPGVLLGQLQHMGNIPYSHLNKLKVKYTWNDDFKYIKIKSPFK